MRVMFRTLFLGTLLSFVLTLASTPVFAQLDDTQTEYSTGKITEVISEEQLPSTTEDEQPFFIQMVKVNPEIGDAFEVQVGSEFQPITADQKLQPGRKVILAEQASGPDGQQTTAIVDVYRVEVIVILSLLFVAVVVAVAGFQGLLALMGMVISLAVIVQWMVPQLLAGTDPMLVGVTGSIVIGAVTMYVSHGFSLKSHLALFSMLSTLILVAVVASLAVRAAQLVGLGSEEAYFLQFGSTAVINLQGLLLGGIVLGALGVLDDITVSQVSVVQQLKLANKKLNWIQLYKRSLAVGRDHVASLVNTLVLAYAGANLPLFLLFSINDYTPLWVTLNSEIIVEEVVRTLVGSMGLVLAVPLTSLVASLAAERWEKFAQSGKNHHGH